MMYYRGFDEFGRCFGHGAGFMNGGLGLLIMGGMLLVAALIVIAVVLIVKKEGRKSKNGQEMELLKTRYVKGEITEEEFNRMKNVLKDNN